MAAEVKAREGTLSAWQWDLEASTFQAVQEAGTEVRVDRWGDTLNLWRNGTIQEVREGHWLVESKPGVLMAFDQGDFEVLFEVTG